MNTATFQFSIRESLKEAWAIFHKHIWFFLSLSLIMLVLNIPDPEKSNQHIVLSLSVALLSMVLSYFCLSVALAAVDGKEGIVGWKSWRAHMPTFRNILMLLEVALLVALAILGGFILLIVPGIYIMVRLSFSQFAYIDRKGRAVAALKYSWSLVTKEVFWKVLSVYVTAITLILVGIIFFGIGWIVTYPLALFLLAKLYRALGVYQQAKQIDIDTLETPEHPPIPVV